ncbi:helix-turn-helix domain-containing protein [Aquisalimonas sp.]|uniref:winged helix-turn-helix transcriptional regulator n=1 Tax=unclassified Aquisalimonas TaxID=2644645 RepID=UPI0025C137B3|nr:helix-turn-helix domain-containing protein [Aquisalimonas sp.]
MSTQQGYGQFCPVAKASEILATRWTPLIMREFISGSSGFNEIHRGVPLMSRPLLAQRLRELMRAGVIVHDGRGAYRLTERGESLAPIIIAMGLWGRQWVESAPDGPDWDAGVLMWDMRRRIDTASLPPGRTVLQFDYSDAPREMSRWWLLIEDDDVDLCQSDPGFEVDLYIASTVRVMGRVWIGQRALLPAMESGEIRAHGRINLERSISRWLMLSVIAEEAMKQSRLTAH